MARIAFGFFVLLAIVLLLTGCAPSVHVDSAPPVPKVVTVDRVVVAACVHKADIPPMPGKVGDQLTGDASHDADILAAALIRMRAWGDQMVALVSGCGG